MKTIAFILTAIAVITLWVSIYQYVDNSLDRSIR